MVSTIVFRQPTLRLRNRFLSPTLSPALHHWAGFLGDSDLDFFGHRDARLSSFQHLDHELRQLHAYLDSTTSTKRTGGFGETTELDDSWQVRVEVPGVPKNQISATVDSGTLHIKASTHDNNAGEGQTKSSHRKFSYRYQLPENADEASIEAEVVDGLLTVKVPKITPAKIEPRHIQITDGKSSTKAAQAQVQAAARETPTTTESTDTATHSNVESHTANHDVGAASGSSASEEESAANKST